MDLREEDIELRSVVTRTQRLYDLVEVNPVGEQAKSSESRVVFVVEQWVC